MPNRLIREKSPYLLSHANNPVNWYPWGDSAFKEARIRDVPIFLSSGYSACHWCHVMERESFENEEVAAVLNENFVSIKLDREERPDIDHIYMEACMAINGNGGWPLSAFLNHDRSPFYAGTYYPKDNFNILLKRIAELWKERRSRLQTSGLMMLKRLSAENTSSEKALMGNECENAYNQLRVVFDEEFGGFGSAPKFPAPQEMLFLMRYGKLNPGSKANEMVKKTLTSIAKGGIFDHIGGGFFRYSTDRYWLVPHFEKMLYDNAMLIMAYGEASVALGNSFGRIAERTVEYVMREMQSPEGAFYTSLDADCGGEEGGIYLYTPPQIIGILGKEDGERFSKEYNITDRGVFEGKSIPNRIGADTMSTEREFYDRCVKLLMEERKTRTAPMRDEKILTSGNCLMIAALSSAGRHLECNSWISIAEKAADFILDNNTHENRLMSRYKDGHTAHKGSLDDYACLVWGLLELYRSTYKPKWLGLSLLWNENMLDLFGRNEGGLFLSGKDVKDIPIRQKVYSDAAVPSGNAVAAMNMLRLSILCSRADLEEKASEIISGVSKQMQSSPMTYAGMLTALLQKENLTELMVTEGIGQSELISVIKGYTPFLHPVVASSEYKEGLERLSPHISDKQKIDGHAAAYLCDKAGCHAPVVDARQLSELLS